MPLFILRESTERPEVLDTGLAALCPTADRLSKCLEELYGTSRLAVAGLREAGSNGVAVAGVCDPGSTGLAEAGYSPNPFGDGHAAGRIVAALTAAFAHPTEVPA